MVDANELIAINQNTEEKGLKLAEVKELFETGTVKIQFYGEDTPSEKEYSYLASYTPATGDTVLLIPMAETYIVLGKILYEVVIPELGYITADQLTETLTAYAKKTDLTVYITDEVLTATLNAYVKTSALSNYVTNTALTSQLANYSRTTHFHTEIHNASYTQYGVDVAKLYNGTPCLSPTNNGVMVNGNPSYKWDVVYAVSGTINTSDEKLKNSIKKIPEKLKQLILNIEPITFKYNNGTSGRLHAGIGARKTERIMKKLGIDLTEFAGIVKFHPVNKKGKELKRYEYGARMDEFIAPMIGVIQDHEKELNILSKTITQQQETINTLVKELNKLKEGQRA